MAKTKQKPQAPAPQSGAASIEDTLTSVSRGVTKFARDYKVPIIIGLVVVIASIGLYGLQQAYRQKQVMDWNNQIYDLMRQEAERIRAGYPALLADLKGKPIEPYAVLQVSNWLCEQNQAGDRVKALGLLRDAQTRHENDGLLNLMASDMEAVAADDASFTIPPSKIPPATEEETKDPASTEAGQPAPAPTTPGEVKTPPKEHDKPAAKETGGSEEGTTTRPSSDGDGDS